MQTQELTKYAPAVFGQTPKQGLSEKYALISTRHVLERLASAGWRVVEAHQTRAKSDVGALVCRHMVKLRHPDMERMDAKGDVIPEFSLLNSHDGSSAYQLHMSIFRKVCANGLIVADSVSHHLSVRHSGKAAEQVVDASFRIIDEAGRVLDNVRSFQSRLLTPAERQDFAARALNLRWPFEKGVKPPVTAAQLLEPRRYGDNEADLWTTFNVVQENIIRGGVPGKTQTGRRYTTRAVGGVNANVRLNKTLWELAEQARIVRVAA